jgi:hypothetical protein
MMASAYASTRLHALALPDTDSPQMAGSNKPANIPLGIGSTGFVEGLVRPTAPGRGR